MPEGERCVQSVSVSRREASAAYVRIRTSVSVPRRESPPPHTSAYVRIRTSVSVSRSALRRYNVGLLTYADIC